MILKTAVLVMVLLMLVGGRQTQAQQIRVDVSDYRTTMFQMLGAAAEARRGHEDFANLDLFKQVGDSGDPLYIAPLIDLAFFGRFGDTPTDAAIFEALQKLSGQDFENDWQAYFEWASANHLDLPPDYDAFKGTFFAVFVDPEFQRFFAPGVQASAQVNLLEPLWGGVVVDGIPSLVNARQITPEAAAEEGLQFDDFCRDGDCRYPADDEYVFGVSIDGDNRAYPLRILNWHEMFNDVLGMAPLYDAPNGDSVCSFRAPTPFQAVARQGEDWVQIVGYSAGCPESGWLQTEFIEWDWESVRDALPDAGESALAPEDGQIGQVKGKPVMLAYCTLCGSGILYDTFVPDLVVNGESLGAATLEFGSTGLLMRSNKVMYDRNTNTAWNALTGTPAWGALASTDIRLPILPVVVTDWQSWLEEHPDTTVLSMDTGYRRNYTNGAAYGDYFNDPDFIMFPVWQQDTSEQENKEIVFTLQIGEAAKAYPLDVIIPEGVTNDSLAGTNVVIVTRATPERDFFEPGGAAVRAYLREDYVFSQGEKRNEITDSDGTIWQVTEDALIGADGERLERLGGHLAFWFGWYSYFPDTLVYGAEP